jgi:hypothetical protein
MFYPKLLCARTMNLFGAAPQNRTNNIPFKTQQPNCRKANCFLAASLLVCCTQPLRPRDHYSVGPQVEPVPGRGNPI